jgi:hypothetical protein
LDGAVFLDQEGEIAKDILLERQAINRPCVRSLQS